MNTDLLKLFPDAVRVPFPLEDQSYHWYIDDSNQYIGIPKSSVTPDQETLLNIFLRPFSEHTEKLNKTALQLNWHKLLYHQDSSPIQEIEDGSYRFIHYDLPDSDINIADFTDAINGFFHNPVICWKDNYSGVIIENTKSASLNNQDFNAVIHTLESDLYAQFRLFIGNNYPLSNSIIASFLTEDACFKAIRLYNTKNKVITFSSAFLDLLLLGKDQSLCITLAKNLIGTLENEKDLLQTIKIYVEANANATVAAKQLFLHRNSLNYRLDKFFELTNLDVRKFDDSLCAYLAIRLLEHTNYQ